MINVKLLASACVFALVLPAVPASAAQMLTFSGLLYSVQEYVGEEGDFYEHPNTFEYNLFYRPEDVVESRNTSYVYDDLVLTAPFFAASGRIGNTQISYHKVRGGITGTYDDPVSFGFGVTDAMYPSLSGSFTDYSLWLGGGGSGSSSPFDDRIRFALPDGTYRSVILENIYTSTADVPAVPEPATWLMMLIGFGAIGSVVRRRRQTIQVSYA